MPESSTFNLCVRPGAYVSTVRSPLAAPDDASCTRNFGNFVFGAKSSERQPLFEIAGRAVGQHRGADPPLRESKSRLILPRAPA
jgi:hypothetical protein